MVAPALIPVDRLDVHVLVDNVTDGLSFNVANAESEWAYHWRMGMAEMSGKCLCCAAHGLSCLLTAHQGGTARTMLFDSGPEDDVFSTNVARLKLDLAPVEQIVLSHGHWDHAGAMLRALEMIRARNGGKPVDYFCHPGMFRSRAMKLPDGAMRPMADVPRPDELTRHGARVVATAEPASLIGGRAMVSGEIPRVTPFETGMPGQHRRTEDGQGWEPDPLLMDERFVAVHVRDRGLVVFTACSHAGIVNVLTEARRLYPGVKLHAALGGFHLSGTNERIIPETVEALKSFGLDLICAGHCTGWKAIAQMYMAFGEKVLAPTAVGKRLVFGA